MTIFEVGRDTLALLALGWGALLLALHPERVDAWLAKLDARWFEAIARQRHRS